MRRSASATVVSETMLGKTGADVIQLSDAIRHGLPQSTLARVKDALQLTDREVSAALGVSEKTVSRLRAAPRSKLSPVASDRLYRVARLFALTEAVLEDEDLARQWLRSPQLGLANRTPLELMQTEAGAREVEQLLIRIEHSEVA